MDGEAPVPLVLYGVPFHNVSFEEAAEWVVRRVRSGRPANIVTANLDFVTKAWSDPEMQRILIDADLVLADGFPMVKLSPFFGPKLKGRVTGSDLTPLLAQRAAEEGISIYGLGSGRGIAEKAFEILKQRNPSLKIAGTYSPPYQRLLEMDHRDILQRLENAAPDILLVAFGAPKQDKFISMHVRDWHIPVSMGVGASLDYITGEQRRAPKWMQRFNLEWLWRVCLDPRRLFNRYLINLNFLLTASRQMYRIHQMPDKPVTFDPLDEPELKILAESGVVAERFQPMDTGKQASEFMKRIGRQSLGRNLLLDMHAVPWCNSLELGALLEINKFCRRGKRRLILYAPRPKVRRLLETCRLTDYFDTAVSLKEVVRMARNLAEHVEGGTEFENGSLRLELPIELTAATLPEFEREARGAMHGLRVRGALRAVEVDAAQLDFIDSAGLGYLISLKKRMEAEEVAMSITHLNPKPRRTFEIARVDSILLPA